MRRVQYSGCEPVTTTWYGAQRIHALGIEVLVREHVVAEPAPLEPADDVEVGREVPRAGGQEVTRLGLEADQRPRPGGHADAAAVVVQVVDRATQEGPVEHEHVAVVGLDRDGSAM